MLKSLRSLSPLLRARGGQSYHVQAGFPKLDDEQTLIDHFNDHHSQNLKVLYTKCTKSPATIISKTDYVKAYWWCPSSLRQHFPEILMAKNIAVEDDLSIYPDPWSKSLPSVARLSHFFTLLPLPREISSEWGRIFTDFAVVKAKEGGYHCGMGLFYEYIKDDGGEERKFFQMYCEKIKANDDLCLGEAIALKTGLLTFSREVKKGKVLIVSDNRNLVSYIKGMHPIPEKYISIIADIMKILNTFQDFDAQHLYREANPIADKLARLGRLHGFIPKSAESFLQQEVDWLWDQKPYVVCREVKATEEELKATGEVKQLAEDA